MLLKNSAVSSFSLWSRLTLIKSLPSLFLRFWFHTRCFHPRPSSLFCPHVLTSCDLCFRTFPPHFSSPQAILPFLSLSWSISLSSPTLWKSISQTCLCSSLVNVQCVALITDNCQGNHETYLLLVSGPHLSPQKTFLLWGHQGFSLLLSTF